MLTFLCSKEYTSILSDGTTERTGQLKVGQNERISGYAINDSENTVVVQLVNGFIIQGIPKTEIVIDGYSD